jgi:hypothetical protein
VDLGGTPNCTGRSVIDNPMVDSGLYSKNIGCIRLFKFKFNLKTSLFMTNPFHDVNSDEELDELKTSMIQMTDLVDDDDTVVVEVTKRIHIDLMITIYLMIMKIILFIFRCSIQIVPG